MASLPFLLVDARTPQPPHDSPLNDGFPRSWLYCFIGIFSPYGGNSGIIFWTVGICFIYWKHLPVYGVYIV